MYCKIVDNDLKTPSMLFFRGGDTSRMKMWSGRYEN